MVYHRNSVEYIKVKLGECHKARPMEGQPGLGNDQSGVDSKAPDPQMRCCHCRVFGLK